MTNKVKLIISTAFAMFAVAFTASCSRTRTETVIPSDDATVSRMYFVAADSLVGLNKAEFIVEDRLDTGLIYNADSIMYGTRVDSVRVVFTFGHTPASAMIFVGDEQGKILTGNDTLDFTQQPMYLYVVSESMAVDKWYKILVTVHQVDPDLFVWQRLSELGVTEVADSRLLSHDGQFYFFYDDGVAISLLTSADGTTWQPQTLSGLPSGIGLRDMVVFDEQFVVSGEGQLFTSSDAVSWSAQTVDLGQVQTTLFVFNDSLWCVVDEGDADSLSLAIGGSDFTFVRKSAVHKSSFAVSDFGSVCFQGVSGRQRGIVLGGRNMDGELLSGSWNVEYSGGTGGYRWTHFPAAKQWTDGVERANLVKYGSKLYCFGAIDAAGEVVDMLESEDEGVVWQVPDSAHNALPVGFKSTPAESVITVDNMLYIAVTGDADGFYSGKLNSIDW